VALQDPWRGSGNGGGFGAPSGGRRANGGGRREQEEQAADADGDSDWDEALLADLSDSEVAELIGEEDSAGDPLAGFDPAVVAAVEAVVGRFAFQLDPFQLKAVAHLLGRKSGELAVWQVGGQAEGQDWKLQCQGMPDACCMCEARAATPLFAQHPCHLPAHLLPACLPAAAVVVCAPTGAGKTAIAEAATMHYLERGQRVIYTTPLKALSNQKLGEMRERFGCVPLLRVLFAEPHCTACCAALYRLLRCTVLRCASLMPCSPVVVW
jgi:Rad3-related DNA helicase